MADLTTLEAWTEEVVRVRTRVLPVARGDLRVLAHDCDALAENAPERAQYAAWKKLATAAQRAFFDLVEAEVEVR